MVRPHRVKAPDRRGHTAVFNVENQQGPAVQHRGLCSILCNNLMVTRGKVGGRDSQGVWDGHGHMATFKIHNHLSTPGQALSGLGCGLIGGCFPKEGSRSTPPSCTQTGGWVSCVRITPDIWTVRLLASKMPFAIVRTLLAPAQLLKCLST